MDDSPNIFIVPIDITKDMETTHRTRPACL